jgi:hypothetical protein
MTKHNVNLWRDSHADAVMAFFDLRRRAAKPFRRNQWAATCCPTWRAGVEQVEQELRRNAVDRGDAGPVRS